MTEIIYHPAIILRKVYRPGRCTTTTSDVAVPQASSLDHLLCTLFIVSLAKVVARHGIKHHQYADDMQIYITSAANKFSNGISTLLASTNDIYAWLTNKGLALNPSRSEVIVFQGQRCAENVVNDVNIVGSNIAISSEVKNLGVVLDKRYRSTNTSQGYAVRVISTSVQYVTCDFH